MPKSSIDPIVARNLRAALELRGRSAYSVANALGHQANWLYMVLKGKKGILIPSLREIARELNVPLSFLVDSPEDIPETDNRTRPDASTTGQKTAATGKTPGSTQEELPITVDDSCIKQGIHEAESREGKLSLEEAALAAREIGSSLQQATLAAKELEVYLDHLTDLTEESTPLGRMDTGPPIQP